MKPILLVPLLVNAAWASAPCEAAPAVQREIDKLPPLSDMFLPPDQRIAPRRALADRYPEDFFAQLAAMRPPRVDKDWEAQIERYRAMKDRDAGDLLEARLWLYADNARGRELIQAVLKRQPDLPAAHLTMLEAVVPPPQMDFDLGEKHFREYRRLCPGSAMAFPYLRTVQDAALLKTSLDQAHGVLLGRTDAEAIRAWSEVVTVLVVNKDVRLRTDILLLRSLALYDRDDWVSLMMAVSIYGPDDGWRDTMRSLVARRSPDSPVAIEYALAMWNRDHPQPVQPDEAARRQYLAARASFLYDLWQKHPGSPAALSQLSFGSATAALSDEQAIQVIEAQRKMSAERPDFQMMGAPSQIDLSEASLYVARKIRLEQVPRLVEAALREMEEEQRADPASRLPGDAGKMILIQNRIRARQTLGECYLLQNDAARARSVLQEMQADLAALKPLADANPQLLRLFTQAEAACQGLAQKVGAAAPTDSPPKV